MDWIESEMAMVSTKAIKLEYKFNFILINLVTYDLVLGYQMYWGVIFTFILLGGMLALPKLNRVNLYPWERMINIEERHHTNYYKFVNMFTDVKHLKESAVRRRYLDFLLPTPKGRKFNSKICIYICIHVAL